MEREDRFDIYTIPPNFAEEGTILSGRVKTRNAVETAVLLSVLGPALLSLDATVKTKMYIGMIVLIPVVLLSVMGVQGESLFAFVASFFRYVRRRRCLSVPDERYRLEQSRRKERARKGGKRKRETGKSRKNEKTAVEAGTEKSQEGTEPGEEKHGQKGKRKFRRKKAQGKAEKRGTDRKPL